jgi:2'-phosphotransferase
MSKRLSWALRHGIHELGLALNPAGYVKLTDLLSHPRFQDMNVQLIQQIVAEDEKQRYSLQDQDGELYIRANQGHTVSDVADEALLTEILSPQDYPFIVHGTQKAAWGVIQSRGLYRMNRNHIRTL